MLPPQAHCWPHSRAGTRSAAPKRAALSVAAQVIWCPTGRPSARLDLNAQGLAYSTGAAAATGVHAPVIRTLCRIVSHTPKQIAHALVMIADADGQDS